MRVMVLVKASKESETGQMPNEQMLRDMGNYNEQLVKAGIMQAGEGLHPTSKAKRVRFSGPQRTVIDGPFAEAKEVIGGFAIIEARSKYEAIALAHRVIDVHVDAGIKDMQMEIRPMFEAGECAGAHAAPEPAAA